MPGRRLRHRLLVASLLLLAGVTRASAQTGGDAMWTQLAQLAAPERIAVLEREARREGQITIYGGMAVDRGQIMVDLFHSRYPDIAADYVRLATNEVPQRLMLEYRAGRVNADLMIDGFDWLGLMRQGLAPYQPTTWDAFDPRFRHGSLADGYVAIDYDSLVEAIAWRTDRINREAAPTSLDEVADPKWKGRTGAISSLEHDVDAFTALYGPELGMTKITALAALDNRIYPSIAGLAQALSTGEIDLAWGVSGQRASQLKAAGAPVDFVFSTPSFASNESIAVVRGARHPYAAALMMEVLSSAAIQEKADRLEPGRAHGNTAGHYDLDLAALHNLVIAAALPPDRYRELNRIVQRLFIRRQ